MSSQTVMILFAALTVGTVLCELAVPYRKSFFYSLAVSGALCCILASFGMPIHVLCGILIFSVLCLYLTCRIIARCRTKRTNKKVGITLSESFADGWILAYCGGCVWLLSEKDKSIRKGDIFKLSDSGKDRIIYYGE